MIFEDDSILHCTICSEKYNPKRNPIVGKCGHSLCSDCVDQMKKMKNQNCPFCKLMNSFEYSTVNYDLMMKIDSLLKKIEETKENDKIKEKCQKHKEVNAYSFCYDDSIFLCKDCIQDHLDIHTVRMFKDSSCLLLNNYHKTAISVRDDFKDYISQQKYNFFNQYSKTINFIYEKEIQNINCIYNNIFKQIEEQKRNLISQLNVLRQKMNNYLNQFNDIEEIYLKYFIKFNEPYISPLFEDVLSNKTKIDYFLFFKKGENTDKLTELFEKICSNDKEKSISEFMKISIEEGYKSIIYKIENINIDISEVIESLVKIENNLNQVNLNSYFNEENYNLIMNNLLFEITNKISNFY